jgi:hypothetical protein
MKRTWILVAAAALAVGGAAPASAQFFGMPVWNSPSGGSGLTINGDYGKPNSGSGGGSAFGGRATLGLGTLSVTAGADSYKPSGGSSTTSFGGDVAFRVIGGPLVPVKINIQGGAAHGSVSGTGITNVTGAVGIGVTLPMPGISIEPYISPGIRYNKIGGALGSSSTNFGFAIGANVGFGMLGVHLAYDHSKVSGQTVSIFGIGAHLALKVPMGM